MGLSGCKAQCWHGKEPVGKYHMHASIFLCMHGNDLERSRSSTIQIVANILNIFNRHKAVLNVNVNSIRFNSWESACVSCGRCND